MFIVMSRFRKKPGSLFIVPMVEFTQTQVQYFFCLHKAEIAERLLDVNIFTVCHYSDCLLL